MTNPNPPPARPAHADPDTIRAGLEAYDEAYSDYIKRGESPPNLAAYVMPANIRALVAEVERLRAQIQTMNTQLEETITRIHHMR